MSDQQFASLAEMTIDELRQAVKRFEELEAHPSWVYVRSLLAQQQTEQVRMLTMAPGRTTTDAYALRNAHLTGWVEGLQYATGLPKALRRIAKRRIDEEQQAAELAAREQGARYE